MDDGTALAVGDGAWLAIGDGVADQTRVGEADSADAVTVADTARVGACVD